MLVFTELSAKKWKNKKGTSERECKCGSWKQHWKKFSGENWPAVCTVYGCINSATMGAHIINNDSSEEWIVPTCDKCNHADNEFYVKNGTKFVSANKSKTCEQV